MVFFVEKCWKIKNDAIRGIETKTDVSNSGFEFVNNATAVRLP